jgi:hypothetical protein
MRRRRLPLCLVVLALASGCGRTPVVGPQDPAAYAAGIENGGDTGSVPGDVAPPPLVQP